MKLTLPQQDIYFEQLLFPNDPIYNIGATIAVSGNIDYAVLSQSFNALINQHDAYRSVVHCHGEEVQIELLDACDPELAFLDFSQENDPAGSAQAYMQKAFLNAFDITAQKPLYQFALVKVNSTSHYIFSMYHHLITDGWGTSLMFQRWVKNYNEILEQGQITSQYPFTYKEFAEHDREYQNSADFLTDGHYWTEKFKQLPEQLLEKKEGSGIINRSDRKELVVKRAVYDQLERIAKESRSSTFHVILAVMYLYFGRKHQRTDFAIGLPVLNRSKASFKKTVGLFMGVTALRMSLQLEDTFENLVTQINQQLRRDYRHQRFPLGKLIQALNVQREKDRLFNLTLSYEKQDYADHFKHTRTTVVPLTHKAERVALALYIREFDQAEDVKIDFDYNLNYFDASTINQVVAHFEHLIGEIVLDPRKKLMDYDYMPDEEKKQLVEDFNQTKYAYPATTLVSLFNHQVNHRSGHLAVKDAANEYTYRQLDTLSTSVANYLRQALGDEEKAPVAVLMERSADLIAILLGIWKAGRAYIPLDPDFPQERLQHIIEHSQVGCVIGAAAFRDRIRFDATFIEADAVIHADVAAPGSAAPALQASDTAYIIYTSGSTGQPKGIEIGHQALLNFLLSIQQKPKISPEDLLFSVTTQSFDISILEFFAPLVSGATLYVADRGVLTDPLAMITRLQQVWPTVMQATPSFFQMLCNAGWQGQKGLKILCGGDLLSESLAEYLLNTCAEVWNMYGPTETTIWSSVKKIMSPKEASNIGKPIHNTRFYILDQFAKPLPIGTVGAIYIGGEGLAKGYYRNELLTKEKFIQSPFSPDQKIYDTGDVGRWNATGEIEFLGRSDNQVKIRGYRIETGEIETRLNQMSAIKSSVVVARKRSNQEASLVAYVIPDQAPIRVDEVIRELRSVLPDYMIPYTIIPVESFPLTPNRKVDRKALVQHVLHSDADMSTVQEPSTELERTLCNYYQEVLKLKSAVGVADNFFTLGGHSLNAVKLIGIIEKKLGYRTSLKTVFDHPTVESLAVFLEGLALQKSTLHPISPATDRAYYPITLPQHSIWLAGMHGEKSIAYNMFVSYDVGGRLDVKNLEKAFREVIGKYEVLRTNVVQFDDVPHQKISPPESVSFEIDRFDMEDSEAEAILEEYVNQEFDLESQLLLRVGLFRKANGGSILTCVTHHVIMDGWSLEVMINEMTDRYKGYTSQSGYAEEALGFQFKDYAVWQHEQELANEPANHRFWKEHLHGYHWKKILTTDHEFFNRKYSGTFYHFEWDRVFLANLEEVALKQKSTLHTLLVSAFYVLLHKMENLEDICVGTINSGRPYSELHNQIGMFVKTLPLRVRIKPEASFSELALKVQEDLLAIDMHQDIPPDVMNTIRLEAIIVLQNPTFDLERIHLDDDLVLKYHPVKPKYNRLPLLINFAVTEKYLHGIIHYDTGKYEEATIELLTLKYKKLLDNVIAGADVLIGDIDMELPFEKEKAIDIDFSF